MTNNAAAVSPDTYDRIWAEFVKHSEAEWNKKFGRQKREAEGCAQMLVDIIKDMEKRYQDACNGVGVNARCPFDHDPRLISEHLKNYQLQLGSDLYKIGYYTWDVKKCLVESDFDQFLVKALKAEAKLKQAELKNNHESEQKLERLWLDFEKGGLNTRGYDPAFKKALELDFKEYVAAALEAKTELMDTEQEVTNE